MSQAPFFALITPVEQPSNGGPPGIWGPPGPWPTPPIYLPPEEPGQPPVVIWGPTDPRPSNPISGIPGLPGWDLIPSHPIVIPPSPPDPEEPPLIIWGGGNVPMPNPPIYIPPVEQPPVDPGEGEPPTDWTAILPTPPSPTGPTRWVVWYNPKYGYKVKKLGESPVIVFGPR